MRIQVSPSKLKLYRECPRKWAHQYLDGHRPPQGGGQHDGELAHRHIETWYLTGTWPDLADYHGRLAAALIPYLPPRDAPDTACEEWLTLDTDSPVHVYRGRIDGRWRCDVWDAKFYAESSREWMVTPETLRDDPQCVLYLAALVRREWSPSASFTMHYVIKPRDREGGNARVESVRVVMGIAELGARVRQLDALSQQMAWHFAFTGAGRANQVPHRSVTACEGIGVRCPHAHRCAVWDRGKPVPWEKQT